MSTDISENKVTAAGIDIGSNSIRMVIAEIENNAIVRILYSKRDTTRLAAGICNTKNISEISFWKSIEALKNYKSVIDDFKVSRVKAVATSAVREAENGLDFINECKKIGINASIISGKEEALLSFYGVKAGVKTLNKRFMIFDTGGGSTEFIAAENDIITFNESYKIGVVKLTDMFDMKDGAAMNIKACSEYISKFILNINVPSNIDLLVATAGTASSIAAMDMKLVKYDAEKINGYIINKQNIEGLLHLIVSTPYLERNKIPGLEFGREDLIIPGILIILEVMNKTGFNLLTVSDYGLREGAVVAAAMA